MSRWRDAFDSHPFQLTWSSLKEALENSTVDDESIVTSVNELARLKKVVEYLDGLIEAVDPEIVPMSTWDSCNQQAAPCLQQINQYNANRNIAHITQANAHIDNLLTYIRPFMVLPKEALAATKRAATAYAKVADEYIASFQEESSRVLGEVVIANERVNECFLAIEGSKKSIDTFEEELFGEDGSSGVKEEITEMVEDFTSKHETIVEYYNETLVGDTSSPSTKSEIAEAKEAIIEDKETIEGLITRVETEVADIEKFHGKVFGELNEDDEREGGISRELDLLKGKLVDFSGEQKEKYNALIKQIDTLLPGATSAGLATAYRDMKESFNNPIRNMSGLFYGSLGLLIFVSLMLAIESVGGEHWISFVNFKEWDTVLKGLVYKLPFYAPVIWLAYYASKRRSEYQRLQQEYAHKESLAQSYISYKKQIEELGDEDKVLLKELIMKSIDTIAYNASDTLDGNHGDKAPTVEALESSFNLIKKWQGK